MLNMVYNDTTNDSLTTSSMTDTFPEYLTRPVGLASLSLQLSVDSPLLFSEADPGETEFLQYRSRRDSLVS